MNALELAQDIIEGRRITREDDLSFFLTCDLKELCEGADRIRAYFIGDKVDLCSIINGRSGRCPEDCKYCAQSAHNHTDCEVYDFLPEEKILDACKMNESEGVEVKAEGMCACSGGIIGMGETWEDRLDMAVSLAELGIDSIPLNALMPIKGTPLENLPQLSEEDILRTIAFFRYINPLANIRLAAGRALLTNDGETAFQSGASATITGNMLTTAACATIRSDRQMLENLHRDVTPDYWR